MARVLIDSDTGNWVHADTGNQISAWAVRNTEPHASELKRRIGGHDTLTPGYGERIAGDVTDQDGRRSIDQPMEVPIVPTVDATRAEEQYVEEILAVQNYV